MLVLLVCISIQEHSRVSGAPHSPISSTQELRVKKPSTSGRPPSPSGSISPVHMALIRKSSHLADIVVQDITHGTAPPALQVPTEQSMTTDISSSVEDFDEFRPLNLDDEYTAPPRHGSAGSLLPAKKRTSGAPKKITECRRKPMIKALSMDGCRTKYIDVGYCQGACRSREVPGEKLTLSGDAFAFVMQSKCRTCRAVVETRLVRMSCNIGPADNSFPRYGESVTTAPIKIVTNCDCMRCSIPWAHSPTEANDYHYSLMTCKGLFSDTRMQYPWA